MKREYNLTVTVVERTVSYAQTLDFDVTASSLDEAVATAENKAREYYENGGDFKVSETDYDVTVTNADKYAKKGRTKKTEIKPIDFVVVEEEDVIEAFEKKMEGSRICRTVCDLFSDCRTSAFEDGHHWGESIDFAGIHVDHYLERVLSEAPKWSDNARHVAQMRKALEAVITDNNFTHVNFA